MKQILQNLKSGQTDVVNLPVPHASNGQLLIQSHRTLVSSGTERMLVEFGKAGYFQKARQQPDKVRLVLDKIKTDGIQPTLEAVFNKLDQPMPLGYCNAGTVTEIGANVHNFAVGDRVVSNGKHAEFVNIPINLAAKIPVNVSDDHAAFTVAGAIALQGIRLAEPTLGETVAVIGLGLIGQLTVQLLKANGCRVIGFDFDSDRLGLAANAGAEVVDLSKSQDPVAAANVFSKSRGVDAALITASTKSNDPVHQAAQMCRKRGRIILVGVAGLELSRADFFEKELTFQVSCSYGPGRYDPNYEVKGNDYPIGFVRWTEQRNFEAVLDMMSDGRLNVAPLISHQFDIDHAKDAYALIMSNTPSLGILLNYPHENQVNQNQIFSYQTQNQNQGVNTKDSLVRVGFVGAGQYAMSKLMPAFKQADVSLSFVASNSGVNGLSAIKKFGFEDSVTNGHDAINNLDVNTIVVATRHNSHAEYVLSGLQASKHVFVEKPLCLTMLDLAKIECAYKKSDTCLKGECLPILMVGFNRRFAPHIIKIKSLLSMISEPKSFVMTVNAGGIDAGHWTQDAEIGGGRIIGEACHFIDLLRHLAESPITGWQRLTLDSATNDTTSIQLAFADGSIGTIHYFANGSKSLAKERLEIFAQGGVLQLDNFRKLTAHGWKGFDGMRLWKQEKGQVACVRAFVNAVKYGLPSPIPFDELIEVSRISLELAR